jgi:hypothetical protein
MADENLAEEFERQTRKRSEERSSKTDRACSSQNTRVQQTDSSSLKPEKNRKIFVLGCQLSMPLSLPTAY